MNDLSFILVPMLHKTTADVYTNYYFSHYLYNTEWY